MSNSSPVDFSKPHLPTKKTGVFTGERGNSGFVPNNQAAMDKIKSFGMDRVDYVNGYPDFSPFTSIQDEKLGKIKGHVEIGHMTTHRQNPHYEYGRRTDSHAMTEDLGNFAQADNELAKSLNILNGTNLTGKDIQEMRERNNLTWHEAEDTKTMQLVPREIHDACPHSGGVSVEGDIYRIVDSESYDFDTGEYNAMDYTYNEERDELTPVKNNKENITSGTYSPKEDEYIYAGKVDANPQYGNGGGTQYFMPYANEMKKDGRLILLDVQVEDPSTRTGSGEPKLVRQYVDKDGVRVTLDLRDMDPDELKELEESCPASADEDRSWTGDEDDLSEEEIAQLQDEVPSDAFLQNYGDEYKHPLTNQESAGIFYGPDGWGDPVQMKPGNVYYQLSMDGNTKSCYFTDQETVDSCRREDGSINYDALREKLQIGNGDEKITLAKYEFRPPLEGEKTDPPATETSVIKNETLETDKLPAEEETVEPSVIPKNSDPVPEPRVSAEHPANCRMVDPEKIDMTYAMGMDSDRFWNHHGNTKEDYIQIAEKIPQVQKELDSGKTLEEIRKNPDLQSTVHAYFDPQNMVKVEINQDGSYSFIDDGRHRVMAAKECGFQIPVKVENMPETVETQDVQVSAEPTVMHTGETTVEQPAETVFDRNGTPLGDEEAKRYRAAMNNMADYLSEHNYSQEDYDTYSKDYKWQDLNAELQKSLGMEVTQYPDTKESVEARYRDAMDNMGKYLSDHNYGREDYGTYSQDPEWQKLNEDLKDAIERKDNFHEDPVTETVKDSPDKAGDNTAAEPTVSSEERYRTAMNNMSDYLNEHNYSQEDYDTYSKDYKWQKLNAELQESLGMEVTQYPDTKESVEARYRDAMDNMGKYLSDHNYGREDYGTYSQDPEWQKLNEELKEAIQRKEDFQEDSGAEEAKEAEDTSDPRDEEKKPEDTSDAQDEEQKPEDTSDAQDEEQKPEDTSDAQDEEKKPEKTSDTQDEEKKPEDTSDTQDEEKKPEKTSDAQDEEKKPEDTSDTQDEEKKPEDTSDTQDEEKKPEDTSDTQDEEKKPEDTSDTQDEEKKPEKTSDVQDKEQKPEDTSDTQDEEKKPEKTSDTQDEEKKPEKTSDAQDKEKKPEDTSNTQDEEKKPEKTSDAQDEEKTPEKTSDVQDKEQKPEKTSDAQDEEKKEDTSETQKETKPTDPVTSSVNLPVDDLNVDEPKKNDPIDEAGNKVLTPDDLNLDEPKKNDPIDEAGNEILAPDDLNVEDKRVDNASDQKDTVKIDSTTIFDDQGNPLSKEEQEKYYETLNDLADYHSEHGYTQQDYDTYSKDPKWQELNQKFGEASKALKKDDLNVDEKKKEDQKEEILKKDDLTTGDQNQDDPEKNKVEEPPKVDIPENTDGGDGGGNRR